MRTQDGFTLMELTAVVSVVGTLAAVAIPSYGQHLARGQVAEAVERIGAARLEVTEHFVSTGVWPATLQAGQRGQHPASVAITAGAGSSGPALTLTATLASTGVNYAIAGKSVELTTRDGGVTWMCRGVSLEPQYLPGVCKS